MNNNRWNLIAFFAVFLSVLQGTICCRGGRILSELEKVIKIEFKLRFREVSAVKQLTVRSKTDDDRHINLCQLRSDESLEQKSLTSVFVTNHRLNVTSISCFKVNSSFSNYFTNFLLWRVFQWRHQNASWQNHQSFREWSQNFDSARNFWFMAKRFTFDAFRFSSTIWHWKALFMTKRNVFGMLIRSKSLQVRLIDGLKFTAATSLVETSCRSMDWK